MFRIIELTFLSIASCTFVFACGDDGGGTADAADPDGDSGAGETTLQETTAANDTTPSEVTGPSESCEGVAATPDWTFLEPIEVLIDRDLPFATVGNQKAGLAGVAYGNGTFVATAQIVGGDKLRWLTSRDGLAWTAHELDPPGGGTTLTTSRVHFQRDRFIFFADFWGGGAWIYTSEDGVDWDVTQLEGTRVFAKEFQSLPDLTVYVGDSNAMASSEDLAVFTPQSPTVGSYSFMDIAAGNGRFVVTANGGVNGYTSDDAVSWDALETLKGHTVEFGNGNFVAFAYPGVKTSPDGITFTDATPSGDRSGWTPRFAGGRFLTIGIADATQMPIAASDDGVAWVSFGAIPFPEKPAEATAQAHTFNDVACGQCTCVFVGISVVQYRSADPWTQDNFALIAAGKVSLD